MTKAVIPKVVITVCEDRIAKLTDEIEKETSLDSIKELEKERDMLCDFIGRGNNEKH